MVKSFKKKLLIGALSAMVCCSFAYEAEAASRAEISQIAVNQKGSNFQYWNKDAASYQVLTNYVKDITDKSSKNYIPEKDRVAVFDMDGTILCETAPYYLSQMLIVDRTLHDKTFTPQADDEKFARQLETWLKDKSAVSKPGSSTPHFASVFNGMTAPEFNAYVKNFMGKPVEGLSNMAWGEAFYLPMVEVIKYLQANKFAVYVVSGSERQLVRQLVSDMLAIPEGNIIGTDMEILAAHQGDTDGLKYMYRHDDYLVRGGFQHKNLQMNKVTAIAREIGKQPVLAFGNSKDDASMLNYAISGNKYKSAAFFVLCDDQTRELGDLDKAEKCRQLAAQNGWNTISMRDDFKTIYGEDIKRTAAPSSAKKELAAKDKSVDYMVFVNKTHKLPDDYEAKLPLITVKNSFGKEFQIEPETYRHFEQLRTALKQKGIQVELDSVYRSVARQKEIVAEFTQKYGADYVKQYVAVPGYSEHHTGLAVDICLVVDGKIIDDNDEMIAQKEIFAQIHPLLADYGFILRYPQGKENLTGYSYEPWHFRYVGQETAKKISGAGLVMEEYMK
ncbi:D-alanyl-D-alanine carboxypeptidase family protein [Selenomonas ruminantium]|uniref:D-alanyl-D-alanine carboxypeptidase family protein n=1 Tax=Selenomonas ruminantium TaxID=971 RepID=UPI000425ED75